MKKKRKNLLTDYLKACRKAAREEEIARHGHPVRIGSVRHSKKVYDRKKMKAGDKRLPDLFLDRNEKDCPAFVAAVSYPLLQRTT